MHPGSTKTNAHVQGRFFLFSNHDENARDGVAAGIRTFQEHSHYRIDAFNFFKWPAPFAFDDSWDWRDCDGIILHDTLVGDVALLSKLDSAMPSSLSEFGGAKILFLPMEHGQTEALEAFAKGGGFDLVVPRPDSEELDKRIGEILERKSLAGRVLRCRSAAHHVLLLCSHAPQRDPRLDWVARFASDDICVHTLGSILVAEKASAEEIEIAGNGGMIITENLFHQRTRTARWDAREADASSAAPAVWNLLAGLGRLVDPRAASASGPSTIDARDIDFAGLAHHFAINAAAMMDAAMRFERIDAIIATDLDSLLPACILKAIWKIPVIYDSHEFWSESFPRFATWEREFWRGIEMRLIPECDAVFTVSDPLAEHMTEIFGVQFQSVPNCEPFMGKAELELAAIPGNAQQTVFLYMGGYAEDRGLEKLVKLWSLTPDDAILHMRGPKDGLYTQLEMLARESGLLDRRIFFLDSVSEAELVPAARQAHVGIIPYEAVGPNHKFCCPNKLSQFCTAGLALLANRLDYVEQCIQRAGNGLVADIERPEEFAAAVSKLCSDRELVLSMKRNSLLFHEQTFNWQEAGKPLYAALDRLLKGRGSEIQQSAISFRSLCGLPAMGWWPVPSVPRPLAPRRSPHEAREAYVKTLLYWMGQRDKKITKLEEDKESLKARLRKQENKIRELSQKRRPFEKWFSRILGKRSGK